MNKKISQQNQKKKIQKPLSIQQNRKEKQSIQHRFLLADSLFTGEIFFLKIILFVFFSK